MGAVCKLNNTVNLTIQYAHEISMVDNDADTDVSSLIFMSQH